MGGTERACLGRWRSELLAEAAGDVLEIGAGTGANLPFYPQAVRRLAADQAGSRHAREAGPPDEGLPGAEIEAAAAAVDALPFDDGAFDAVVSTLVLCSVPDVERALAEVRRVLRPGGKLLFLEHIAADDRPERLAWQRRLEPLWTRVSGNCHLTRRTGEAIRAAGFRVQRETRESMRKALPIVRPSVRGLAIR